MILRLYLYAIVMLSVYWKDVEPVKTPLAFKRTLYYFSMNGNDKNDGSIARPLKTIAYLNTLNLNAGDVSKISNLDSYKIIGASPVTQAGLGLQTLFNIDTGNKDFNGNPINKKYFGACTQ